MQFSSDLPCDPESHRKIFDERPIIALLLGLRGLIFCEYASVRNIMAAHTV